MRICLYGGAGIGKSVLASWLFYKLKQQHISVELINEYIKQWAWEGRKPESFDQMYIFAKQLRQEDILVRRGVHIVTDSPLPLQLAYAKQQNCPFYEDLLSLCKKFDKDHPAVHILLKRTAPFDAEGRYETYSQAVQMDYNIHNLLDSYSPGHYIYIDPLDEIGREAVLTAAIAAICRGN
jgi:hypothetical protein